MPNYANPLYANGVPTYSNEVGALADVFKALAPNPLRDLQIQGYASNARLHQLQGDVIQNQQGGLSKVANALRSNNYQEIGPAAIESGNLQYLDNIYKAGPAQLAMRGLMPGQPPLSDAEQQAVSTAVGATGGNVANTFYGFGRTADEIHRKNNLESDDRRQGNQLQYSVGMAGVGENRRFHDLTSNEDIRNHNMQNSATMAGVSEQARGHTLTNLEDIRSHDLESHDRQFTSNNSLAGTVFSSNNTRAASEYTADKNLEGKKFDTLNDQRKSTPGGAVMDPSKFDDALIQTLPGSTQDDKGWMVNPSVAPADLAEVRSRAASYFRQDPRDPYGAIQRARADVFGQAPSITPAQAPWLSSNTPEQVNTLPADQRPPLPNLARQFEAPQGGAPVPLPAAAPAAAPAGLHPDLIAAKNAVASGKSRQAVIQRLIQSGRTPQEIQAAGI